MNIYKLIYQTSYESSGRGYIDGRYQHYTDVGFRETFAPITATSEETASEAGRKMFGRNFRRVELIGPA